MPHLQPNRVPDIEIADPRWKDLYKIGGIASIMGVIIILLAVIVFFIWPYAPGFTTTVGVFETIQHDRLGGLMALDFFLVVGNLISILFYLAIYAALKRVNESFALIALVLGLIAVVSLIPARPIAELFALSDRYAAASNEAERSQYLAAGEALLTLFNGTAWAVYYFLGPISGLISSLLMLRSNIFSKATAYVGIITSIIACGLLVPGIGPVLAFLSMLGYVIWNILLARKFFQLGRWSVPDYKDEG